MKKILFALFVLTLLVGCVQQITNFEECAAAGNPVMESYPRQCRANGQTFVEVLEEPIQPPERPIGGERDEHGCLGPAGYRWSEDVGACIREWELSDVQKQAAKIAVDTLGRDTGLTVVEVLVARCPGCFEVEFTDVNYQGNKVLIENWKVKEIK